MLFVRKIRLFGLMGMIVALALLTTACAGEQGLEEGDAGGGDQQGETVIVGSANFTEQLILANMYAQALEAKGVKTETQLNVGSREVLFPAFLEGEVNLVPEYTGALLNYLKAQEGGVTSTETEELVSQLRDELEPKGIAVLEPSPAQDRDALAVTQETAEKYNLQTVADLARVDDQLVAGGPPEEKTRHVGLPGLKEVYGIEFGDFRTLDAGGPLTFGALKNGDIDVGRVFTTQGQIEAMNLVVLEETKPLIPAENIIPVIHEDVLTPEIEQTLNELSSKLTTEELTKLNAAVDIDKEDPEAVARQWLEDNGMTEN